jgi:hypothetical protein
MDTAEKKAWIHLACTVQAIGIDPDGFRNLVHAIADLPVDEDTIADLLDHAINMRGCDPADIGQVLENELRDHGLDIAS